MMMKIILSRKSQEFHTLFLICITICRLYSGFFYFYSFFIIFPFYSFFFKFKYFLFLLDGLIFPVHFTFQSCAQKCMSLEFAIGCGWSQHRPYLGFNFNECCVRKNFRPYFVVDLQRSTNWEKLLYRFSTQLRYRFPMSSCLQKLLI